MSTAATAFSNGSHQAHRVTEPDFSELGPYLSGPMQFSAREHQVVAMLACGFNDDRIIAGHLGINVKYVQNIVHKLKERYGWQNRRAMGRAYQTLSENKKGAATMSSAAAPAKTAVSPTSSQQLAPDPTALYPADVIAAAKEQMAKPARGRRYGDVLTDEVLAIWHAWHEDGKTLAQIAKHNGLIQLRVNALSSIMKRYRQRLAAGLAAPPVEVEPETAVTTPPPPAPIAPPAKAATAVAAAVETESETKPETAVSQPDPLPKPEIEALATAVEPFQVERPENLPTFFDREYRPAPRPTPGDALAALAALVNDEQLRVKGSVKLNLEIEFG